MYWRSKKIRKIKNLRGFDGKYMIIFFKTIFYENIQNKEVKYYNKLYVALKSNKRSSKDSIKI